VSGVGLLVLGEAGPPPVVVEVAEVLGAEGRAPPALGRDGGGQRHHVQPGAAEALTGAEGEQPAHPQ
jgi:hypothetical protein